MQNAIRVGLLVVLALGAVLDLRVLAAEKLVIEKINVPQLDLFVDDKGTTKIATLDAANVKVPLDVISKAPNGRLKIRLPDGREAWIDGTWVKVRSSGPVATPCDPGRNIVAGATRSSGAPCK
jgi:hypothetical protein